MRLTLALLKKIVEEIHKQGAIAIACHPHHKPSEGKQPFIYLWRNWKKYVDIFDAWDVANRDDLFNVIGLKKFNYIANSDFHELWHIYSWKSLIGSEKNTEAIKAAIRENKKVAIYLFRKEKARGGISSLKSPDICKEYDHQACTADGEEDSSPWNRFPHREFHRYPDRRSDAKPRGCAWKTCDKKASGMIPSLKIRWDIYGDIDPSALLRIQCEFRSR